MMKNKIKEAPKLFWGDVCRFYKIGILIVTLWAIFSLTLGTPCTSVLLFGIPCPLCGITRAMWYCIRFQFANAFAIQPLWPLVPLGALIFILYRYFRLYSRKVFFIYCELALFMLCLLYGYRMITAFPSDPPYIYTEPNAVSLMKKIIDSINSK